jgi:hypothetical protein
MTIPVRTETKTATPMSTKQAMAIPNSFSASRAKVTRRSDSAGFGASLGVFIRLDMRNIEYLNPQTDKRPGPGNALTVHVDFKFVESRCDAVG